MAETFEVKIRPNAASTKAQVIAWLEERSFTNIAYGIVDGIDDALAADGEAAFGDEDATPLAVYLPDVGEAEALIAALGAAFGDAATLSLARLRDVSWQEAWDESSAPIVTRRFTVVRDAGATAEALRAGRMPLLILPGEAFGNGRHATTQVALEVLEDWAGTATRDGAAWRMLDVGTGSGILAIAAWYLGSRSVVGTDIDLAALAEARRNALANGVTLELQEGSVPPDDGRVYELVAANILAPVLHELLPILARRLAPAGRLLLAGFIAKEAEPLLAKAKLLGLEAVARRECRGWVGLLLAPRPTR